MARQLYGRWTHHSQSKLQRITKQLDNNFVHPPTERIVYKPPPRVAKEVTKAKKRHNLQAMAEKQKKFPPIILEQKRQYLMDRLQDKRGIGWYKKSWQESLAKRRYKQEREKYSFLKPMNRESLEESRRYHLLRIISRKSELEFISS
eukprot:TRINITY_DN2314_c0_g1_i1.p1 TRINITY_DN2314_c0_g1~~TRINITY_DN2314_c0_g1_i1.p1  ORF type:complete len:147 (+),score=28.69 TRINITY_DN2314_c0_g1_i1:28-468(+)